jgi:hypothetical protein
LDAPVVVLWSFNFELCKDIRVGFALSPVFDLELIIRDMDVLEDA